MNLATHRPTLHTGYFEAHVTVRAPSSHERARFAAQCQSLGVKAVEIALGEHGAPTQPMTASVLRGSLPHAIAEATRLAHTLEANEFSVARVKLEALGRNAVMPERDDEARARSSYFEFHVKVLHGVDDDLTALRACCVLHRAHLSRNARGVEARGALGRFATLRVYDLGRFAANARFDALMASLTAAGYSLGRRQREYVVYDSNATLDGNWGAP